ncbi:MAG: hypothetical protein JWM18_2860 [Chloroflexi bacterium]|jgi:hypothetical protein|nr:hypothetical protein [Chloroflexota bacterium]
MKVLAVHDAKGNISGFVVHPVDGPPGAVTVRPGEQMTEVELPPEVNLDLIGDDDSLERLVGVLHAFRIEMMARTGLLRKDSPNA